MYVKATEGLVQQRFGKSGGSVLRMTVFRKFEVCASYESSVVKSPPSPSPNPLWATWGSILFRILAHSRNSRIADKTQPSHAGGNSD